MGTFDFARRKSQANNMKAYIALACLAAVALAEPYYGYGYGRGYYGGYRGYYGKRSADAESEPKSDADPWVYGYGLHTPYTYGGYGYGLGYHGLGYTYGKRSADAEPKADADPYLVYGGLHTPYTYGYGLGYG